MSSPLQPLDPIVLRNAFARFPSGVAALAAEVDEQKHVLLASSFTVGASLDPPLVAFFVQSSSSTWPALARAERIGVSVLGADHADRCGQLSARDRLTRLNGIDTISSASGAIRIEGAPVWFECSIFDAHAAGDHQVVLLLVHRFEVEEAAMPLVFHGSRFTQLAGGGPNHLMVR